MQGGDRHLSQGLKPQCQGGGSFRCSIPRRKAIRSSGVCSVAVDAPKGPANISWRHTPPQPMGQDLKSVKGRTCASASLLLLFSRGLSGCIQATSRRWPIFRCFLVECCWRVDGSQCSGSVLRPQNPVSCQRPPDPASPNRHSFHKSLQTASETSPLWRAWAAPPRLPHAAIDDGVVLP